MRKYILFVALLIATTGLSAEVVHFNSHAVKKSNIPISNFKLKDINAKIISIKPRPNDEIVPIKIKNIGAKDIPQGLLQVTLYNKTSSGLHRVEGTTKKNMYTIKRGQDYTYYCSFYPCYKGKSLVAKIVYTVNNSLVATKSLTYNAKNISVKKVKLVKINNNKHKLVYKIANATPFILNIHVVIQPMSKQGISMHIENKYVKIKSHTAKEDTFYINGGDLSTVEIKIDLPYYYHCTGKGDINLYKRTIKSKRSNLFFK